MPHNNVSKPYHSLIHLGCGASPNLDEYLALAEHVWLIDADLQALGSLEKACRELANVHLVHALADAEQHPGTFYRYSLPWANGPAPLDDATQRLYPGLRGLGSEEQTTTPVDALLSQCLSEQEELGRHLLLLDVGNNNSPLLQALEESGLLSRLAAVIVLPAHRREQPVPVPFSLHPAGMPPKGLTLPDHSQVLTRHPLILELERHKTQLAEYEAIRKENAHQLEEVTNVLREVETQLEKRTEERDQIKQQLTERDKQLVERSLQLDEAKHTFSQKAEQHAQELTAEQEKTAQLIKERDQFIHQRDEEWNKGELLAKERDEALRQNHQNAEARNAAEARVTKLEKELVEANKFRQSLLSAMGENAPVNALSDGFYRALEDRFRGSRESIKQRLSVYLPFVRPIAARHPDVPALDLGCGRGELLEVLKEADIAGHGIDQDARMLEGCEALGLSVEQGDAIAYLREQPDASRICISLIHVVEHIPFDMLRTTVAQAKRVLVPDGILIMETPNPENYTVGSCSFYMDPTHRHPLPPPLLAFVPEYYDFERVKVLRLQESPSILDKDHFDTIDYLNGISPDYAVIAQLAVPTNSAQKSGEQHCWEREYGISFSSMTQKNSKAEQHCE